MNTASQPKAKFGGDLPAEQLPLVQYAFVHMLTEHLVDCRRAFNGDLDAMLVLAVTGQNHIKGLMAGADYPSTVGMSYGMSASRIADVIEIPRETVRRKLAALQRRGWLTQNDNAGWELSGDIQEPVARLDLASLSLRC